MVLIFAAVFTHWHTRWSKKVTGRAISSSLAKRLQKSAFSPVIWYLFAYQKKRSCPTTKNYQTSNQKWRVSESAITGGIKHNNQTQNQLNYRYVSTLWECTHINSDLVKMILKSHDFFAPDSALMWFLFWLLPTSYYKLNLESTTNKLATVSSHYHWQLPFWATG